MLKVIVAVLDSKSNIYHEPRFVAALGQAVRGFEDAVKDKEEKGDLQKHPDDFSLYHLGTFDDNAGVFDPINPPTLICRGSDFVITGGVQRVS